MLVLQNRTFQKCIWFTWNTWPFHKILDSLEKVEAWAKDAKVDCSKSFGHFLDDPEVVEHERLRSHVGCIVDQNKTDLPENFKMKTLPAGKYVVADFMGSPAIGPMKVYKKARQYFFDKGLTPPEIRWKFIIELMRKR